MYRTSESINRDFADSYDTRNLAEIVIMVSDKKQVYIRSVYKFIDLLGDVGGFSGIFIPAGAYLLYLISPRSMSSAIYQDLYNTKKSQRNFP